MTRTLKVFLLAFFLLLPARAATAADTGLLVHGTYQSAEREGEVTLRLAPGLVRLDYELGDEEKGRVLFNQEKETAWMIDMVEESAMEISRSDMEKIRALMEQLRQHLEQLPPEQREMIEGHMKGQMPFESPEELEVKYEAIAGEETVEPWTARQYRILSVAEDREVGRIWTVPREVLGIEEGDLEPLEDFAQFLKIVSGDIPVNLDFFPEEREDFQGFPVKSVSYRDGEEKDRTRIREITRVSFEGHLFEVPDGIEVKGVQLP